MTLPGAYPREFWWGKVLTPRDSPSNVVHLRKFDRNHPPFRWWSSLVGSLHVVGHPSRIFLENRPAAVAALALAVDVVMAGDLVFACFRDYISGRVTSPHFAKSLDNTSPMCNSFFEKVGLADEWGPITAATGEWRHGDQPNRFTRGKRYGLLFFLLAEASGFVEVDKEENAYDLGYRLDDLLSKPERGTADRTPTAEHDVVEAIWRWLHAWKARELPPLEVVPASVQGAAPSRADPATMQNNAASSEEAERGGTDQGNTISLTHVVSHQAGGI